MKPKLYVGNKNYSSWSLRAWLCLEWSALDYEEVLIPLAQPGYGKAEIAAVLDVSPSGRVPAVQADEGSIWDSLAIAEWAAEKAPGAGLWPDAPAARARARAVTCEMHSGFFGIRDDMPMNIHGRRQAPPWSPATLAEIQRVNDLWNNCRRDFQNDGPWLFGTRSIADAFYAPVVTRFRTYGVSVEGSAEAYCNTLLSDPSFLMWQDASDPESWDREGFPTIDGLYQRRSGS